MKFLLLLLAGVAFLVFAGPKAAVWTRAGAASAQAGAESPDGDSLAVAAATPLPPGRRFVWDQSLQRYVEQDAGGSPARKDAGVRRGQAKPLSTAGSAIEKQWGWQSNTALEQPARR